MTLQRYVRLGTRKLAVTAVRRGLLAAPDPGPLDPTGAIRELRDGGTLSFVCLGNICRSPMAERYARAALAEAAIDDVSVRSAGFVRTPDRPSPELAVETARERGVDLSDHTSTPLTPDLLADSDVLALMDSRNYYDLLRRFPGARDRTYFLRPFADPVDDGFEIPDPDGTSREQFRAVYATVAVAVDSLVERLDADRSA